VSFGRPEWLWLLLLPCGLLVWLVRGRRLRQSSWRTLTQRGTVPGLRSPSMLVAAILLILALAQPRFGPLLAQKLPPGQDVVLLVDVSRSMGVHDAVPTRLGVAIEAATSLLAALAPEVGNRAAVVAFAGRGVLRCPLTENLGAVRDALQRLRPASVMPGGTNLGAGIDAALEAFGEDERAEGRSIVIFSDGEDHAERWRSRLDRLVQRGVIVHAVAIGDPDEGHPVPTENKDQPLIFEGNRVLSRRVDQALAAIAQRTDGAMLKLGLTATDLGTLYRERIAPVARRKREDAIPERSEQFPVCLAAALGFLLSGCWPTGRPSPWRWIWSRATGGLLIAGIALLGIGAGQRDDGPSGKRGTSDTAVELVRQGQAAYEEGKLNEALAAFEAATRLVPEQPVPRYDAAATLFRLERYAEARDLYLQARKTAGPALQMKIDYALGNTALGLGEIASAVEDYDRCMASTARDPELDVVREDAAVNRQFALEQANPSLGGQGDDEGDTARSSSRQGSRPPGARKRGRDGNEPTPDEADDSDQQSGGPNPQSDAQGRSSGGRRRTGGAGGASKSEGTPGESADDRLDDALQQIRDAQHRRLPEESETEPPGDLRKDW
jgi:Ca-activated chloride channel family protein